MSDIYTFSNMGHESRSVAEKDVDGQLSLLKDVEWFHGDIDRKEAEKRVLVNGEFLVRLSRNNESRFVVSTKWNGKHLHVVVKSELVPPPRNGLLFYIVPKFKFGSIKELIYFHKEGQYPLSNSSEAVLYKAVVPQVEGGTIKKEHRFRKSMHASHRTGAGSRALPRSDSETVLGAGSSQRLSLITTTSPFSDLNKSLSSLPTTDSGYSPQKPSRPPGARVSTSRLVLARVRPKNVQIRNDKLFTEGGDYSDYTQLGDNEGGLEREKVRRGLSLDVRSPSLFGLNMSSLDRPVVTGLGPRRDSAPYPSSQGAWSPREVNSSLQRESSYVLPQNEVKRFNTRSKSASDLLHPLSGGGDPRQSSFRLFSLQGSLPRNHTSSPSISLHSFLNLSSLSSLSLACCGPIETAFDTVAINKASSFLLSHPNHPQALCIHLLEELRRIFTQASSTVTSFSIGYRTLFLIESDQIQKDFSIRQTALTDFIMATIVCATSSDRRVKLILFWTKCAEILLTQFNDMFHFRSVVTAIFSEQITNLKVWKTAYRHDPSLIICIESLRKAISNGCFMRLEIQECVPDIVQLYTVFTDKNSDFEEMCKLSLGIISWCSQSFTGTSTWLWKVLKDLDCAPTVPFLRELVQTETLLCLILGRSNVSREEVTPLLEKVEQCIKVMASLRNEVTS